MIIRALYWLDSAQRQERRGYETRAWPNISARENKKGNPVARIGDTAERRQHIAEVWIVE
jgi:hypothetical protein